MMMCKGIVFPNTSENETEYYYENSEDMLFFFFSTFATVVNNEYIHGMYLHILEEVTNESICLHYIFYIIPSMHNNGRR